MNPEHHEDRLRLWARATNKPVLSLDYGKAPECEHIAQNTRLATQAYQIHILSQLKKRSTFTDFFLQQVY